MKLGPGYLAPNQTICRTTRANFRVVGTVVYIVATAQLRCLACESERCVTQGMLNTLYFNRTSKINLTFEAVPSRF